MWQELICYWERLTALIKHIESLQTPLSGKLAIARANEFAHWGRTQTPTLLDTGRLIFRSQVPSLPSSLNHSVLASAQRLLCFTAITHPLHTCQKGPESPLLSFSCISSSHIQQEKWMTFSTWLALQVLLRYGLMQKLREQQLDAIIDTALAGTFPGLGLLNSSSI